MGDNGKLYVSNEIVSIYRDEVIKRAKVLLPNQTECEFLTGVTIRNEEDAVAALDKLHSVGIPVIILKSLTYLSGEIAILGSSQQQGIYSSILCSDRKGANGEITTTRFKCKVPKIDRYFSGTGDLFASLFTVSLW
jgi:pyridoxine kinase